MSEDIKEVLAKIDKYSPCFVVEDEIYKQVLDNDFRKLTSIIEKLLETESELREQIAQEIKGLHKEVPNELGYRNCLEVFKSLCENCSDEQQQPVAYPCRGLSEVLQAIRGK